LFERTSRAFRVTAEGLNYYERCRTALDGIEQADALVKSRRDDLAGVLRISVPVVLGKYLLRDVVASFLISHPRAHVHLEVSDRIAEMVPEGIDLSVRLGAAPADTSLVARVLAHPSAGLYASAAYLRDHGVPRTPDDLPGHRILNLGTLDAAVKWTLQRGGETTSQQLKPLLQTNDIPTLLGAAMQGCGICMAPHFVCMQERLPEVLLPVLPEWEHAPVEVRALYPSRRSVTPLLRAFLDLLIERAPRALDNVPPHGGAGSGGSGQVLS
jgi:DNA-binding transcriptional LysR family regulator